MNLYFKITGFVLFTVLFFGIAVPFLISAKNTVLFLTGVLAIFCYPPIIVLFLKWIKKGKNHEKN